MKKVFNISLLFLTLMNFGGCNKSDPNLEPNIIKDQYRTYYEIFVGAFSDGDNDGLGDFKEYKKEKVEYYTPKGV